MYSLSIASLLLLSAASACVGASDPAVTPFARDEYAEALMARQLADSDALASASSALSIYYNVGTTAFSLPTGTACAAGYQSYVNTAGNTRCCAGSIINNRCFQDTNGLVYTADPQAVIDGETTPPAAATAVTSTAAVLGDGDGDASTSSSFSFSSSYKGTATGGTRKVQTAVSTTVSRLSQTLTPTGKSSDSNNAGVSSGATANAIAGVFVFSATALLAGSSLLL